MYMYMVYGVPDFQSLSVERLCDSVTGNWPAVLSVSSVGNLNSGCSDKLSAVSFQPHMLILQLTLQHLLQKSAQHNDNTCV